MKPETLEALINHHFELYGPRNDKFLPAYMMRYNFFLSSIGELVDAVDKKAGKKAIGTALARSTSRLFCVLHRFPEVPFIEAVVTKYGLGYCSYCRQSPCVCDRRSRPAVPKALLPAPRGLSLGQWTRALDVHYGAVNRRRGRWYILSRLQQESGELGREILKYALLPLPRWTDQLKADAAGEMADSLAWLAAAGNYYRIDLEREIVNRYWPVCHKCKAKPCQCGPFNVDQVDWFADRDLIT